MHTVIDLFCGAGGFSEGFRQAGFEIVLGVDIWDTALESFQANHHCDVMKADIRNLTSDDLPDADIIIGSPPCKNISYGNRKRDVSKGLELIRAFERIIELKKPKYWVWENVAAIKWYYRQASLIDSFNFGLPQRRTRAFIANFPFFLTKYYKGEWTEPLIYSGTRADNKSRSAKKHTTCSGTVRTKRIRNVRTGEYLSIQEVKRLMGFPGEYFLAGSISDQQTQLGNAVCPPVAHAIAAGIAGNVWATV